MASSAIVAATVTARFPCYLARCVLFFTRYFRLTYCVWICSLHGSFRYILINTKCILLDSVSRSMYLLLILIQMFSVPEWKGYHWHGMQVHNENQQKTKVTGWKIEMESGGGTSKHQAIGVVSKEFVWRATLHGTALIHICIRTAKPRAYFMHEHSCA